MKKCSICDKEVDDGIDICPNCGHDFNFKYKLNQKDFEENYTYEEIRDSSRRELEEEKDSYSLYGLSTVNPLKILDRKKELEPKIYEFEKNNRFNIAFFLASTLLFSLISLLGLDSFGIYVAGVSLVITFLLSALFIITGYNHKRKIIGDFWLLIEGINLFITSYFYFFWNDTERIEDMSIDHTLFVMCTLVSIGLSVAYIIKVGKIFPLYPTLLKSIGIIFAVFAILATLIRLTHNNFVFTNRRIVGDIICVILSLFVGSMLATVINDIRLFFVNNARDNV